MIRFAIIITCMPYTVSNIVSVFIVSCYIIISHDFFQFKHFMHGLQAMIAILWYILHAIIIPETNAINVNYKDTFTENILIKLTM